ncbi:SDR family NAD(P)-dependent oxidoreductase [uncultured Pseudoteredinibacter sp.]|uniref:SDR family NAD(P)-dependent oxidoreductase n=1 Tax=uncultured Pseudoteredinibacter sp. TaxID=1641701 RepID=UPI00261F4835|nr:SDR family NAD(P)-dependent oxidoreductase [uncultured Pseudoteredinibacter sp.]
MTEKQEVALVVGAGDAIGSAIARRFAQEGYTVVAVRRNGDKLQSLVSEIEAAGGNAHGWSVDARDEEAITTLFARIESEVGPLAVTVFNVGANVPMKILETSSRKFSKIWEMACFGGFLTGREAAKTMLPHGKGTIIFTGATASVRGAAGFAAFASAKHGLRALAQSMARELAPQNIHVAHVVIDAAVDTQWIRENFLVHKQDRPEDDIVQPSSIAEAYVQLHRQPRDAWTFEMDLRPWVETW